MFNARIRQAARFCFFAAAAPAVNGCVANASDADQAPENAEAAELAVATVTPPVLTLAPVQRHHICYQDSNDPYTGDLRYVFKCRASNGACTITGSHLATRTVTTTNGNETIQNVSYPSSIYNSLNPALDSTTFTFADGTTASCSFDVGTGSPGTPGATLEGYTTDASGLVTTGVWKHHSNSITNPHQTLAHGNIYVHNGVAPPSDFVSVGGGVVGIPDAAFVVLSQRAGGWSGATASNLTAVDHDNDVYVIGMKVEGWLNYNMTLASLVGTTSGYSTGGTNVAHPSAQATLPLNSVALGGGGYGYAPYPSDGYGQQYLTDSQPVLTAGCLGVASLCTPAQVSGWLVKSKDHWVSAPGYAVAEVESVPTDVTVNGSPFHFVGFVNAQWHSSSSTPTATVYGDAGEFALTGIGAYVNWDNGTNPGNLLWELKPRADIAGAEVGSTDHGATSPASITAYTVGVKLVPGHS